MHLGLGNDNDILAGLWLAREIRVDHNILGKMVRTIREGERLPYTLSFRKKRNGGKRLVCIPDGPLGDIQDKINKYILRPIASHPCSFGYSKGSIYDALSPHAGARRVLTVDCKNAFHSVTREDVVECLTGRYVVAIGYDGWWRDYERLHEGVVGWNAANILADLVTCFVPMEFYSRPRKPHDGVYPKVLPQGAPTSPRMFDIACALLDDAQQKMARQSGCVYTRYADNLFFSTREREFPKGFVRGVGACMEGRGVYFAGPNFAPHKQRLWQNSNEGAIRMIGLNLMGDKVRPPRDYIRRIRKGIHHVSWLLDHGMEWEGPWNVLKGQMGFALRATLPDPLRQQYHQLAERIQQEV